VITQSHKGKENNPVIKDSHRTALGIGRNK